VSQKNKIINLALVEDQLMFREGLKAIISSFPNILIKLECSNGKEFLEQVNDDIEIVLMDIDLLMPLKFTQTQTAVGSI